MLGESPGGGGAHRPGVKSTCNTSNVLCSSDLKAPSLIRMVIISEVLRNYGAGDTDRGGGKPRVHPMASHERLNTAHITAFVETSMSGEAAGL